MEIREWVSGKISRGNEDGLTELGLIIIAVVVAVAVVIIFLASTHKF